MDVDADSDKDKKPTKLPAPAPMVAPTRVLCAADTPAGARLAVDRVAALGMKRVYLTVPLGAAPAPPAVDPRDHIAAAALAEGKTKGVAVYAVVNLLARDRRIDRAKSSLAPDLAITGETATEGASRRATRAPMTCATWRFVIT